jgi:maltooligosyltrehalose trehalohydrolase
MPIGVEILPEGVHARVWAPQSKRVALVLDADGSRHPLNAGGDGYFSGFIKGAAAGTLYRYALDEDSTHYPDPVSRYQPSGPHGPSAIVDPGPYQWVNRRDDLMQRTSDIIIYEMHVGTFTREGTWRAASDRLPQLAELGITALEMMPIAEFPGRFGWGYDGVDLFAPYHHYGTPDDLRGFVDAAHGHGIAVILDVVYNHLGPDGNFLTKFNARYFSDNADYKNEWGDAINFDGPGKEGVREFFLCNAGYWIREFHFDGLRLDATQSIHDFSDGEHILGALTRAAREAAPERRILIVAENEPQNVRLLMPTDRGGFAMDAAWNDDFHHSAHVALTGRSEAYYSDYRGRPQEFVSAARRGFLYQGQWYSWQKQSRGTPTLGLHPERFIAFIENHDQIANSLRAARMGRESDPATLRAFNALLLLMPSIPMLFQGQEYGSTVPFSYFADHEPDLARAVADGRKDFLAQFPSLAVAESIATLQDPADVRTFEQCKLDPAERERNGETLALFRDLVALRKNDRVLSDPHAAQVDGAVLGDEAFLLRWIRPDQDDRLLIVNPGNFVHFNPAPEPLLAPPTPVGWQTLWSSDSVRYGGTGTPQVYGEGGWRLPARSAVLLAPGTAKRTMSNHAATGGRPTGGIDD